MTTMLPDALNEFLRLLYKKILTELRQDNRFSKYSDEQLGQIMMDVQFKGKLLKEFYGTAIVRLLNPTGFENLTYVYGDENKQI